METYPDLSIKHIYIYRCIYICVFSARQRGVAPWLEVSPFHLWEALEHMTRRCGKEGCKGCYGDDWDKAWFRLCRGEDGRNRKREWARESESQTIARRNGDRKGGEKPIERDRDREKERQMKKDRRAKWGHIKNKIGHMKGKKTEREVYIYMYI